MIMALTEVQFLLAQCLGLGLGFIIGPMLIFMSVLEIKFFKSK
jgi:hypothetical protein